MKKLLTIVLASLSFLGASAQDTPLMGWSSWNAFGFKISDQIIRQQADAMVTSGLKDVGYNYINIDDGYFGGRDEDGHLLIHPTRFPNGMRTVVDYIHSKGLKAGIYSDAGENTCASYFGGDSIGVGVGLYGHDKEDCWFFFHDLDFDFMKIDFCGGSPYHNKDKRYLSEQIRYTDIAKAIKATGKKDVRVNACRWDYPGIWVSNVAGSWRTTHDIACHWSSVADIIKQNLYLSAYCIKGHYNDMDMLEVGRGLKPEEDKTHFALWCIMNSPLLVGCDMNKVKPEALALMANKDLIALNQDPLCQQAYPCQKINGCFALVKDILQQNGNTRAIAIYNPDETSHSIQMPIADIDLQNATYVKDVYTGADVTKLNIKMQKVGKSKKKIEMLCVDSIPAHGTAVFTITADTRLDRSVYEAESAFNPSYQELKNNQAEHTGVYEYDDNCRSGMKASWLGRNEDNCLIFNNVYVSQAGERDITIAYLSGEDRIINIEVNGKKIEKLTCNSGGFNKVGTITVKASLNQGRNTIRLYNNRYNMPDIDYIEVSR